MCIRMARNISIVGYLIKHYHIMHKVLKTKRTVFILRKNKILQPKHT